jgi:hypothetical protein
MKRLRPELVAMFDTDGVLPLADPLPRYSTNPDMMPVSHRDWMNTFLSRFILYCETESNEGRQPTMKDFCENNSGANSKETLRNLGAKLVQVSGVRYKKKHRPDYAPRFLTPLGVVEVEKRWHEFTGKRSRPKAAVIGETMLENNLLAYEPETDTIIHVEDLIDAQQ